MSTNGVLIVDKPRGPTSHDVVARVRKALGTRHVGHAGTLDPMATGVLVVAVGEGTKLVPYLTADDKAYEATVRLGIATDTLDAEGRELERATLDEELAGAISNVAAGKIGEALPEALARAVEGERARTSQVPPAFSAIKIGGQRAHELARRGEAPELAPRDVAVRSLEITGGRVEPGGRVELDIALEVTKGYFVRSLARDLAAALGTFGHLTALRRTRSGAFTATDAVALDHDLRAALIPLDVAAGRALPVSTLGETGVVAAARGQRVPPSEIASPHPRASAWLDGSGRLVAIGETLPDGSGRVLRGFPTSSPSPSRA